MKTSASWSLKFSEPVAMYPDNIFSLYGLKQPSRVWFGHFSTVVQELGMIQCDGDHSGFYHVKEPGLPSQN